MSYDETVKPKRWEEYWKSFKKRLMKTIVIIFTVVTELVFNSAPLHYIQAVSNADRVLNGKF